MGDEETSRDITPAQADALREAAKGCLKPRSQGTNPNGITQTELARRMGGYDQGALSKFLKGTQGMSYSRARQLCQVLGIEDEKIFGRTDGVASPRRYRAIERAIEVMDRLWLRETIEAFPSLALKHPGQPTVDQLIELGNLIDKQARGEEVGRAMDESDDETLEP